MFNRPYVVEVRSDLEYLQSVIREARWQHDAARNRSRSLEATFEILVAKCRIVTYQTAMKEARAFFPFDVHGAFHKRGAAYTLAIRESGCAIADLASVKRMEACWSNTRWATESKVEALMVELPALDDLKPEQLLEGIQELSIREVMSG